MKLFDNHELDRLKIKIRENPHDFIVILGSGMSIPAGLPSWGMLKEKLIDEYTQSPDFNYTMYETIIDNNDYWSSFETLCELLGEHQFIKIIRNELDVSKKIAPNTYRKIWELDINGIITFNLDKFVIDSYSEQFRIAGDYATGKENFKYKNFLSSFFKFVLFAHGIISDETSWIWTDKAKKDLYRNNEYKNFLSIVLNSFT
jgi:hypothetical protein